MSPDPFAPAPFDGRKFSNASGRENRGIFAALRWLLTRRRARWPRHVPIELSQKPAEFVDDATLRVTLVGHSTVLLQVAGLNILTDPVFSERAGPFSWFGPRRVSPPAIAFEDLPRIQAILLSHDHYDHLDRPTLKALIKRDRPYILAGLEVGWSVPAENTIELDWWETYRLSDRVTATFVPAEHCSARTLFDRNTSLWGGFVIETPVGSIYFAGDTGAGTHFEAIRHRFGPMALSLLPIGAYAPKWFMAAFHMNPAEAVRASITLASEVSLAIHFGAFPLADDDYDQPAGALADALATYQGMDFRIAPLGKPIVLRAGRILQDTGEAKRHV